jgi:hypothetical protein
MLPAGMQPRAGVPQDRHTHALLPGGLAALDDLFNGYTRQCSRLAQKWTTWAYSRSRISQPARAARAHARHQTAESVTSADRGDRASLRLAVSGNRRAGRPARHGDRPYAGRCRGVGGQIRCEARDGTLENHEADLVIDASSRGEPTLEFLRATGREAPRETTIGGDLYYSTAVVEFADGYTPAFQAMLTLPNAPDSSLTGVIFVREDEYLFAALGGCGKDAPPVDCLSICA